ncbi:MAG TPA: hypothetical protein VF849_01365 [Blattabacteriaceae bacterium]
MTIEQLLECSAEKLEAMSDSELNSYLSPYFNITRPELQVKTEHTIKGSKQANMELNIKLNQARAIAKSFGIELP